MDLNLKSVGALTAASQGVSGVFVAWRDDGLAVLIACREKEKTRADNSRFVGLSGGEGGSEMWIRSDQT